MFEPEIAGESISVQPWIFDMRGVQPYHIVLFGEKSSLEPILGNIAERYEGDLYLTSGEISNTLVFYMARDAAADGRPMVALCISDCDPAGWQMPISIARKLQAFKVTHFPHLEFQVRRVALTPEQARPLGLPGSPLKEGERRADKWRQRMGIEQIEIDSLATLAPDKLTKIVIDAVKPFYDGSLARRVNEAYRDWTTAAQVIVDKLVDKKTLAEANERLAQLRKHVRDEVAAINQLQAIDTSKLELPAVAVPEAVDNSDEAPEPLINSSWSFIDQTRALIESKAYEQ